MKTWDELTLPEQAAMMKVAVKNGIYDLPTIRQKYNEFAEGGGISDEEYYSTMEKVAEDNYQKWGLGSPDEALVHALNDNTYNYRGYYDAYPQSTADASTHWPDEFKTVYHPTFSDESIYSGQRSQYNPLGLTGGYWVGDTFIPRAWQMLDSNKHSIGGPLVEAAMNEYANGGGIHIAPSKKGTFTAAAKKHGKSVQAFASQVLAHPENYSPAMRKKANFARNAKKFKHSLGGPLTENILYSEDENIYGFGDWLENAYNKAISVINKGRKIVKNLGLDESPAQHIAEKVSKVNDKTKSTRQQGNNNLGFWERNGLAAAKAIGLDERYKDNDTDTHYRQNLFNLVDPTDAVPQTVGDAFDYWRIAEAARSDKNYKYRRTHTEATADAGWAKRLGLPYDTTLLIANPDGSVHLSEQVEKEIPTDTVFLKNRIANNEKQLNKNYGAKKQAVKLALKFDKEALEVFRYTYKTGEPVKMHEASHMGRSWIKNGKVDYGITPLSILHKYTLQHNKENNTMSYFDIYDFDEFEDFVPGKPFQIKGVINLNKR